VTDATEQALVASGVIPAAPDTIPLIIEDKTFVPADIAQQDAKWNTTSSGVADPVWGAQSDLWFPHVYEPNQDPQSALGTNPVGRFDYGPLFWPIFPAFNPTPTGHTDDATIVPTAYFDTPVINGTAYPTLTVDPKAYRFRILNASVDRYLNLGLYKADTTPGIAPMRDANGNPMFNAAGVQQFFSGTEVKLVPALAADAAGNPPVANNSNGLLPNGPAASIAPYSANGAAYDPACQCQYPALAQNVNAAASGPTRAWPIDSRRGGVPDPLSVGPDIIAIGNDGGFLPNPVDIPSQPMTYEANRRSITVNNAYGYGLLLGPAERSDAIIDFSQYAGQTLIVYNDAPAPFPFSDERNDYYTGNPDMSAVGGAYATQPGYGPNTRTIMQIKVSNATPVPYTKATPASPGGPTALGDALATAYAATQAAPLVPAVAYNKAFNTNDPDIYAHIATGAAAQPTLDFTTTGAAALVLNKPTLLSSGGTVTAAGSMVYNNGSGSGYDPLSPPRVVFNNTVNGASCLAAGGVTASAKATVDPLTHQVNGITNFVAGSGYTCLPTVSFVNTSTVKSLALINGGSGYVTPLVEITGGDGSGATATAVVVNGVITGFTITNPGTDYTVVPTVTITEAMADGSSNTSAQANATLSPTLGVGAQVAVTATGGNIHSLKVLPLAEQELFDNRGRYNYTGGVEMPFTNAINQTTVPLNYIDAATESIADGETQVWKITVNGLFSNNLSFNLADVQLINRVGWDGTVKPPSSNELGWKSTVRMNPLEDVLVAVRANRAKVPFGMPKSARAQDPSKPVGAAGSEMGFTFGQGVPQMSSLVNRSMNYDNEFFWGSTLLSNAENDFTRPIVFSPTVELPAAPTDLKDAMGNGILTWIDPTPAGLAATLANPQNEIGFKIMQATLDANGNVGGFTQAVSATGTPVAVPANTTSWAQPLPVQPSTVYAVVAFNAAGDSPQSANFVQEIPLAPTVFSADFTPDTTDAPTLVNFYNAVSLTWSGGTASNKLNLYRTDAATGLRTLLATLAGTATAYVDNTVTALMGYSYQIEATNALQPTATGAAISAALDVTTPMIPVNAPTIVSAVPNNNGTAVVLRWTDNASNETMYWIDVSANGAPAIRTTLARTAAQATQVGAALNTTIATVAGNVYTVSVTAVNVTGTATSTSAPATTAVDLSVPVLAAPATLTAGLQTATRAPFSWTAVAAPATVPATTVTYVVQVNTNGAVDASGALVWTNLAPTATLAANPAIAAGNSYQFQVLSRATRFGISTLSATPSQAMDVFTAPALSTAVQAVAVGVGTSQIALNWSNLSSNITGWTVQRRPNFGLVRVFTVLTPASVGGTSPSYTLTDTVPALGSYTYRITALNVQGSGPVATSNNATAQ
jgi:fibronectin type 3 domain-containing protein